MAVTSYTKQMAILIADTAAEAATLVPALADGSTIIVKSIPIKMYTVLDGASYLVGILIPQKI